MAALLSIASVAERLDVSESTIRAMVKDGILPYYRIGMGRGKLKFDLRDIEAYIAGQRRESVEPRLPTLNRVLTRRPDGRPLRPL
jgi:excisionase family DNA binding protein